VTTAGVALELDLSRIADRFLLRVIEEGKECEPAVTSLLKGVLKEGYTFIDVGANIGYFSVLAGKAVGRTGRVYAIEPFQRSLGRLRRNVEINLLSNVTVVPYAAWKEEGIMRLYVSDLGEDRNSLLPTKTEAFKKSESVRTMKLDSVIPTGDSRVVMKLDVEGAEPQVLLGAARLLKSRRVVAIVLEWVKWYYDKIVDLQMRFDLYLSIGSVFVIGERTGDPGYALYPVTTRREIPQICNLLLVPKPNLDS